MTEQKMEFRQFATRMAKFLEEDRLAKMYNQSLVAATRPSAPQLCGYQCALCDEIVITDINPVYRHGWTCVKGDQYVCVACAYDVSLLASIEQIHYNSQVITQ